MRIAAADQSWFLEENGLASLDDAEGRLCDKGLSRQMMVCSFASVADDGCCIGDRDSRDRQFLQNDPCQSLSAIAIETRAQIRDGAVGDFENLLGVIRRLAFAQSLDGIENVNEQHGAQ